MRSAVVTGASTGIGRATALHLDARGWRVFAGVRREADAESLRQAGSGRLVPLMLDVTDPTQIAAAAERVASEVGEAGLDGLVNNAGIAIPGPLETLPLDDFRRQVEVNLTAQLAVTQAMLPAIRVSQGRIVFVTSIGGRIAFPLFGAYHAAKFGLEAVGDVFRRELHRWGIAVSIVEPGSIATDIWERGERETDAVVERGPAEMEALYGKAIAYHRKTVRKVAARGIPPERVAKTIERALTSRRPRARYQVGLDARSQVAMNWLFSDRLIDRIIARVTRI